MDRNSETQTVPQAESGETTKTTFSIPADLLKAVKIAAINLGMDAQDIYVEAVREYLSKKTKAA